MPRSAPPASCFACHAFQSSPICTPSSTANVITASRRVEAAPSAHLQDLPGTRWRGGGQGAREYGAPLPLLRGRHSGAQPAARHQRRCMLRSGDHPTPPAQPQTSDESACSWIVAPTHHMLGLTRACSASTAVPSN